MDTHEAKHTSAWTFQVWIAFLLAFGLSGVGIVLLPLAFWPKAFVALAYVFTVAQAFTLAKTVRDDHESKRIVHRLQEAKAEKILRDFELEAARRGEA